MRTRAWAVGLFLILGFALFTGILFLVGDRQKAFSKHIQLYTEFANLGGLTNGAKVRVSGLDAGQVKKIEIPTSASAKFRLELQVDEKMRGMIRRDSVASIETTGVVGDKFVLIRKGSDQAPEAPPGATLPGKEPFELSSMLEKSSGLLNDVSDSIKDIRGRVDVTLDTMTKTVDHADHMILSVQPRIQKILSDGSQITGNLNLLAADLQNGKGPAGLLLKDERTREQLQATLADVKQTTANLEQASNQVNGILTDFQSRELIAKADSTLQNVQQLSERLNVICKEAFGEDNVGENGASNLRSTLSNLNRSTANMADDTEALKHNFLFRGYFKKRGYYNLEQLTPKDYVSANAQKHVTRRQWFRATTTFEASTDGAEQLSRNGRQQIDNAVAPMVHALPSQPIIVEGYSVQGSPSQQFVTSRKRAEIVRRYLETHYHLNHQNLGIVALCNKPPDGAGVNDWDGAAIVLVNAGEATQ
jgi:phospholipid/cholesterol/gamma-HCH transport system substrate-binding protein